MIWLTAQPLNIIWVRIVCFLKWSGIKMWQLTKQYKCYDSETLSDYFANTPPPICMNVSYCSTDEAHPLASRITWFYKWVIDLGWQELNRSILCHQNYLRYSLLSFRTSSIVKCSTSPHVKRCQHITLAQGRRPCSTCPWQSITIKADRRCGKFLHQLGAMS